MKIKNALKQKEILKQQKLDKQNQSSESDLKII